MREREEESHPESPEAEKNAGEASADCARAWCGVAAVPGADPRRDVLLVVGGEGTDRTEAVRQARRERGVRVAMVDAGHYEADTADTRRRLAMHATISGLALREMPATLPDDSPTGPDPFREPIIIDTPEGYARRRYRSGSDVSTLLGMAAAVGAAMPWDDYRPTSSIRDPLRRRQVEEQHAHGAAIKAEADARRARRAAKRASHRGAK